MKKNKLLPLLLFAILCLTGCSKEQEFSEAYDPNTDFQHTYKDAIDYQRRVQCGNGGEYILHDKFIYFYNEEKGLLSPLCNKANCLHDKETGE